MTARAVMNSTGTTLGEASIGKFQGSLRGEVLRPDDDGYDAARTVWNGMVDKRPALIGRCTGAADVIRCVRFAREHDLLASVRGGGHNYSGRSVCDHGLMIDLSPMKGIRVDPVRRTAQAEAGLRLGELDYETQAFGLATPLGINTDTGIAGLTLGGGYGWLGGKYGLACDNVLSVDVVTADGELMTASANENEDLFWGVRVAGANFGIVTSFHYQLHPVGPVLGGLVLYPMTEAKDVLRFYDEFSSTCPDEVTTLALLLTTPDGIPAVGIAACYCGPLDQGEEVLRPLRTFSSPLADFITSQPYVQMQSLFDEHWPPGWLYYVKAQNIRNLNDGAIETMLEYARALPTPFSSIVLQQLHGAASRIPENDTAFPYRYDHYDLLAHSATDNPADCEKMIGWARECWQALQPFVEKAVYANAVEGFTEPSQEQIRQAYGSNYDRLTKLKKKYDPTNFFRLNPNIPPATA